MVLYPRWIKNSFLGANSRFPLQVLVQNRRERIIRQGAPHVALAGWRSRSVKSCVL